MDQLLTQGAPINAVDPQGEMALILAVTQGHAAVVRRLLAASADRLIVDSKGIDGIAARAPSWGARTSPTC